MIPYGRQDITQDDIDAVVDILTSDFLTQGPAVPAFEARLCDVTGSKYASAVNSATSALHISCLALGLGQGDRLWTVPNSFVASANCGIYCGAMVDFVDIDPVTLNICVTALETKLEQASKVGKLPKILVVVHFGGEPCDLAKIHELSGKYGFRIIEDASHAVGASYKGQPVGNCRYSDVTIFSFHPVKIVTSGEGGAVLTNCSELDQELKLLRSHGITRDPNLMQNPNNAVWYYEQIKLGFNYRMTDIHAALGTSQLSRLSEYISKRHEFAEVYDRELSGSNVQLPFRNANHISALHLYVIQVNEENRHTIFNSLRENGIGVNLHYIPIHTQPYYQAMGFRWGDYPNAETYSKRAISLPMYATLQQEQQHFVIESLKLLCND